MTAGPSPTFDVEATLHPAWCSFLQKCQIACGFVGAAAVVAQHGMLLSASIARMVAGVIVAAQLVPLLVLMLRYRWSRTRATFLREQRFDLLFSLIWPAGLAALAGLGALAGTADEPYGAREWLFGWTEVVAVLRGLQALYATIHAAASAGLNPALVLAISFAALIGVGTILLMLPRCRPEGEAAAPFLKALFTATSASCVTGLVLDPPGSYWSRTGQVVILGLIQLGGLGIMTFGAFFALVLGRKLPVKEQITFRELLESQRMGDIGGMIRAILGFTLGIELVGALLLTTLWPELPFSERLYYGVFHGVSAFCNAGFCLRDAGLVGWERKFGVIAVIPTLIILGGLGFTALDNWRRVILDRFAARSSFTTTGAPARLSLTTRLVTVTTLGLLVVGTLLMYVLERDNPAHPLPEGNQWANAWFHSVTLRTAGFNTIDHEQLRPATKLLGIIFMFIGASPGSTGGGVKTICLALTFLTLRSVLRGRSAVETGGRAIPEEQVFRGLAIITLGLATLMFAALLIVIIENNPARLLDQLYEAASAFGTVGVSANLTPTLKPASQVVLIATMFLGRVGPLTLIIALAGANRSRAYHYPEERIALG
jgi:trk system potassium uptake protein TrkH